MNPTPPIKMGIRMKHIPFPQNGEQITHRFELTVGIPQKGSPFIDHPELAREIKKEKIPPETPVGIIVVRVNTNPRTIEGAHIDSIGHYPITKSPDLLHRSGLDVWAELRVERFLKKNYPKYRYHEHPHARNSPRSRPTAHVEQPGVDLRIEHVYTRTLHEAVNLLRKQKGKIPRLRPAARRRRGS